MSIAGLILAAGRGTRFGADKRLARLPDGRTLLEVALARHAGISQPLLIVLRPDDEAATALARQHGAHILICENADQGMGHSLACGARALLAMPDLTGVLIDLADMPAVSATTLKRVQQALRDTGQAVAPRYQGRIGQPRGLPRACFEAVSQLHGDQGARHLLDWQQAVHVEVDDAGILLDIDRPADLAALGTSAA